MHRLVVVVALVVACKTAPSQGGLPPAQDWDSDKASAGSGTMPPGHPPVTKAPDPLPPDHPPVDKKSKTLAKLADGRLALGPYSIAVPAGWTEVATTSDMRAAQFAIGNDAELVVYYFGPDGAGSVQDNIDRWLAQFVQPDGKPSKDVAKVERMKLLGHDATIVSVSGRFTAMAMPGAPEPVDKDDQSLLAAITGSSAGPYYWKLVGARSTVAANAAKFRGLLTSLKLK